MIDTWFIADTHFCHKNILRYESSFRPFANIEEHDEELIRRWNLTVKPNDIIYHLGDFALGGKANVIEIGRRLNGKKRLIMGNHDVYPIDYYLAVFEKIYGVLAYKNMILSHVPLHREHTRYELNVHGHLHSKQVKSDGWCLTKNEQFPDQEILTNLDDPHYFCVSVEQINLTPIHFDVIKTYLDNFDA